MSEEWQPDPQRALRVLLIVVGAMAVLVVLNGLQVAMITGGTVAVAVALVVAVVALARRQP